VTAVPDTTAIQDYLRDDPVVAATAEEIEQALIAETCAQADRCRVEPYTDALAEALMRRVARNLAMRSVPLGVQADEMGGKYIGSNDPEVRRLEGPYRRLVVG